MTGMQSHSQQAPAVQLPSKSVAAVDDTCEARAANSMCQVLPGTADPWLEVELPRRTKGSLYRA